MAVADSTSPPLRHVLQVDIGQLSLAPSSARCLGRQLVEAPTRVVAHTREQDRAGAFCSGDDSTVSLHDRGRGPGGASGWARAIRGAGSAALGPEVQDGRAWRGAHVGSRADRRLPAGRDLRPVRDARRLAALSFDAVERLSACRAKGQRPRRALSSSRVDATHPPLSATRLQPPPWVLPMSPIEHVQSLPPVRGSRGSQAVRRRLPRWGDAAGCGVGLPRSAGAAWAPTACLWPRTPDVCGSLRQRPAAHRRAWIHPFVRDQHGGWRPLMHGAPYEVFAPGRSRDTNL